MGESYAEYIARRDDAEGTQRLRVPRRYRDNEGNVIAHVAHIYAVDSNNVVHELVDTSGNLIGGSAGAPRYDWPGGTTISVEGTYTRTGGAGNAVLELVPATGDELILMYGVFRVGGVKVGVGQGRCEVMSGTQIIATWMRDDNMSANEEDHIPGLGNAANQNNNYTYLASPYQLLLTPTETLRFTMNTMANAETFLIKLRFRSITGADPTITPTGGTFV